MEKNLKRSVNLYDMGVVKRSIVVWAMFQIILWTVFGIAMLINPNAWNVVPQAGSVAPEASSLFGTFLYIVGRNLILFLIIIFANMFARFGIISLGLIIILFQGIMIGYVAGSNSFEYPFSSVLEANLQYLKVGLWETTAYALICAATITKSLYIAETFPPKKWSEERKLKDIKFAASEVIVCIIAFLMLVAAGYIEAVYIIEA